MGESYVRGQHIVYFQRSGKYIINTFWYFREPHHNSPWMNVLQIQAQSLVWLPKTINSLMHILKQ